MHSRHPRRLAGMLVAVIAFATACSSAALAFTIGDCVNLPDGEEISEYESVDCDDVHDAEVFALPQHPDGEDAPFPGDEALNEFVMERCEAEFEPYVGIAYDATTDLYFTALTPSADSWTSASDREVVCLLVGEPVGDGFAQLTGSKQGSGG